MLTPRAKFMLYHYAPSIGAAVVFIVLFGISTLIHTYQLFRTRTWFFIPFLIGGYCEVLGYIARAVSAAQPYGEWTLSPYIVQTVLVLVAPSLFAASVYMELGRIVELVQGDQYLFIRRRWLTGIFVLGDVVSFLMQAGGGSLMAADSLKTRDFGKKIIVIGLFVQIIFFGIFVLASSLFYVRVVRQPTARSLHMPWRKHMFALFGMSMLILIRSIFRVVEFLQGYNGPIFQSEAYLYIFDALLMLFVMVIVNWFHPSEIRSLLRGGLAAVGVFRMVDMRKGDERPDGVLD